MTQRGQIFTNGSAETPREMARRLMREELSTELSGLHEADLCAANCPICKAEELAELDTPYGALVALPECPSCGRTGGDPLELPVDMAAVERAAHLYSCFYPERAKEICDEEGIAASHRHAGSALNNHRRDTRASLKTWYGDPAYGSWPPKAGDEMRDREARFIAEHPGLFSAFHGCTLCDPRREREQPFEVQEDGDVTF